MVRLKTYWFEIITLILIAVISTLAAFDFLQMHRAEPLYPSAALTDIKKLSDYNAFLEGTRGETDIYFFDSGEEGGTALILGGTHPNEPAGFVASVLILENLSVDRGRVIVIPRANHSAFTHNDPQEGHPQYFTLSDDRGARTFRHGARVTNQIDQWPDPEIYLHYPSGQKLAGKETRNLNRAYPGVKDGTLTERVAYAIVQLIKSEKVHLAFDLHEASPEYPVVNAIVASERSQELASEAAIELQFEGLEYSIEPSPYNYHGLSHREWTDFTETVPILLESANPLQGRLRGRTDERLLIGGEDKMYLKGSRLNVLTVPYDSTGIPLKRRVGRHLAAIQKVTRIFSDNNPAEAIEFTGLPDYDQLMDKGVIQYLTIKHKGD